MFKNILQRIAAFNCSVLAKRFGPVYLLYLLIISIAFITRVALLIKSASGFDWSFINVIGVFAIGLFYDTIMASYFCIPIVLYIWLLPNKVFKAKAHRFVWYGIFILSTFLLLFNIVSEWTFWDEFSTRYNFIAVDYLVYTNEVIGNIWESYPVVKIIIAILLLTIAVFYFLKDKIKLSAQSQMRFVKRTPIALLLLAIPVLSWFFVRNNGKNFSENQYAVELAGDGLYDFGAAFWNNELDYYKFYATIDDQKAFQIVRDLLKRDSVTYTSTGTSIERKITNPEPEKKYNIVLISVESLSADYVGVYDSKFHITPNLDTIAKKGLMFSHLYASGTRTVRGLEALSLSIPPTPGQSIVKRPNNENLFSIGNLLDKKGYHSQYIYGGYGYFDNMNYFFEHNGYEVVDRKAIASKDIHYENIWGVADEDLFTLAINKLDQDYKIGKPFFSHIMTVSNHRPFTYPEGRIDIPSHTNQEGAVKYTDYAIGKFLKEAKTKPWFDNTIFVIVADHCASSAGKTELPAYRYHIPLIFYAPKIIKPSINDQVISQIDIAPTILGLMHLNYDSKFYGRDIFKVQKDEEWAFISTYEKLGFIRDGHLLVLSPQKKIEQYKILPNHDQIPEKVDEKLKEEAIAFYQTASYLYKNKLYNK
ncbi:MAG: sulfatase-like hydrolase/transferase [Sphingobacteriales bacterium]|nr:sulfatase-like hydrolase/transferase [Sphingobacteriales bacterium]